MLAYKVFTTTGARVITALLGLAVMIISTRAFGEEGYGVITMLVLGIMFIGVVNDLAGGSALIYLIPRHGLSRILPLAYFWSLVTAGVGAIIIYYAEPRIAGPYALHIFLVALIHNWFSVNLKVLLGKERITWFNVLTVLQLLFMVLSLLLFIHLASREQIMVYIMAMYLSYGLCFLVSLAMVRKHIHTLKMPGTNILREMGKLGLFTQLANFSQFLNYRLSYYFIQSLWLQPGQGAAPLGVYSAMNRLAEGNWLISKSLALVQYAVLSNREEEQYAQTLTLAFLKLSVLVTLLVTLLLVVLPGTFYQWLLGGTRFDQIPFLIACFSPGILAMAVSHALSHYFAAKGLQRLNAWSSLLGLAVTVSAAIMLIPAYGLPGAAVASSMAHLASCTWLMVAFIKHTRTPLKAFFIKNDDLKMVKRVLKNSVFT